jgi:general secretion pathway protein J
MSVKRVNSMAARGFTLIEVLIAMAMFAMIGLASYSVFSAVTDGERLSREHTGKLNDIQRALLIIERDITQITERKVRLNGNQPRDEFIYSNSGSFTSSSQSLGFVRQGWRNPLLVLPRSDLQAIAYQLEDNNLYRLHFNFVDPIVGAEPKKRLLIAGVNALEFEFFHDKKWQSRFNGTRLPQALAIELDIEGFGLLRRQFLVAGMPANIEAGDEG